MLPLDNLVLCGLSHPSLVSFRSTKTHLLLPRSVYLHSTFASLTEFSSINSSSHLARTPIFHFLRSSPIGLFRLKWEKCIFLKIFSSRLVPSFHCFHWTITIGNVCVCRHIIVSARGISIPLFFIHRILFLGPGNSVTVGRPNNKGGSVKWKDGFL